MWPGSAAAVTRATLALALAVTGRNVLADFKLGNIYTTATFYECPGGFSDRVYEFDPVTKEWKLFAELPSCLSLTGLTFTPDGQYLRAAVYGSSTILEIAGDGSWNVALNNSNGISFPLGYNCIAYDPQGNFFVLNMGPARIWKFPAGGGPGFQFSTGGVTGHGPIAAGRDGSIYYNPPGYLPDPNQPGAILRYASDGSMSLLKLVPAVIGSLAADASGNLYFTATTGPGGGLFWYAGADPDKSGFIPTFQYIGDDKAIALSPDQRTLYAWGGIVAIDLEVGTWSSIGTLPELPGLGVWGRGLAVYAPGPVCSSDLDLDGVVCQSDLGILLGAYGTCPWQPGYSPRAAGLAGDECVAQDDLGALLSQYGQCGATCP